MKPVQKKRKREYLIKVFIIAAILSVLTGLFLLVYFIIVLKSYFTGNTGAISVRELIQEVDILGCIYGVLWLFVGMFLYIMALHVQVRILKLKIEDKYFFPGSLPYINNKSESEFINQIKKHLDFINRKYFDYEEYIVQEHKTVKRTTKGVEFLYFLRSEFTALYKAFGAGKYPSDKDGDIKMQEFCHIFEKYGVTSEIYRQIIQDKVLSGEISLLSYISGKIFGKYQGYLEPYFSLMKETLSVIGKTTDNSEKENKSFLNYVDFFQAHLSHPELFILYYYSLTEPELKQLFIESRFLEYIYSDDILTPAHSQFYGITLKKRAEKSTAS
jgi:hypothetical protein